MMDNGVTCELAKRFIDNGMVILKSVKSGWRCTLKGLKFNEEWEDTDMEITDIKMTARELDG